MTPEYGLISQQVYYVEDQWNTVYSGSNTLHLDRGFITPYAGSQPSEDFVEVVATLLAFGQTWFDSEVAKASPEGRDILRQKEGLVVDYFKASWGIEFRALQQHIADAKPAQPNPPIMNFLGEGKEYNFVELNWGNIASSSQALWAAFNDESVSESDRALSSYRLSPLDDGSLMIRVARFAAGAGTTGSASFARIFFTMTNNADGTVSFTYSQPGTDPYAANTGGTQTALRNVSDGLIAFMEGNRFVWDWGTDAMETGSLWVVDEQGVKTGEALTGSFGNY